MTGGYHLGGHATGLDYHRVLLDDDHRVLAYERAIRRLVRPGDVVLDLGAGTGVLSMLAARRGAARVHAVESMGISALAAALVKANGLEGQIRIHRADARRLEPVEAVDLVVSDCLGRFLVDDGMLPAVAAAAKWMKPTAAFCPSRVRLMLGPVAVPLRPIQGFARPFLGLDLSPAVSVARHTCYHGDLAEEALLAQPAAYHEIRMPDVSAAFDHKVVFTVRQAGSLSAVAGWFVATLAPGVLLSTAPGEETHWGQYLFPVPTTVVQPGDRIPFHLWLEQAAAGPVWHWRGAVERDGKTLSEFDLDALQRLDQPGEPWLPAVTPGRQAAIDANRQAAEAFVVGRFEEAVAGCAAALRSVSPDDDDLLAPLYENLGLAYLNLGDLSASVRALSRALDGELASREQSLRYLGVCLVQLGRQRDAVRAIRAYQQAFGPHPDGLSLQGEAE